MPRYAAFLRGINVSGRRVTNEGLRSAFEAMGFDDVGTFRASGNVVFDSGGARPRALAGRIEEGLREALGYEVITFVRSGAQVRAIACAEPFEPKRVESSAGKVQVLLLTGEPKAAARKTVLALATDRDLLAIEGSELFWLPSGGISDSDLDLDAIARALGPGTMRTKGTIEQIASKFFG